MTSLPLVPTKIRHKPKGLATFTTDIGPVASMNPNVLRSSPSPFEPHLAPFPWASQGPIIQMNLSMLNQILMRKKLFATSFFWTYILFMQCKIMLRAEAHRAPLDIACVFFCCFLFLLFFYRVWSGFGFLLPWLLVDGWIRAGIFRLWWFCSQASDWCFFNLLLNVKLTGASCNGRLCFGLRFCFQPAAASYCGWLFFRLVFDIWFTTASKNSWAFSWGCLSCRSIRNFRFFVRYLGCDTFMFLGTYPW